MAQTHSLDLETSSSQYAYITDANQTGLDITSGGITISAWVKLESAVAYQAIIHKGHDGGAADRVTNYAVEFGADGISPRFWFTNSNNWHIWTATPNLSTGVWTHLAFTYTFGTGSSIKCYINGQDVAGSWTTGDGSVSPANNADNVWVGCQYTTTPGLYLDGLLKDVRIFNDVRTAAEVATDAHTQAVSDANLKAEWGFNNVYTDASGNSNTLTSSGSPIFVTTIPWEDNNAVLRSNDALDLESGSSQYASITDASQTGLDITEDFTIEAWIRRESTGAIQAIAGKYDATNNKRQYMMRIDASDRIEVYASDDGTSSAGHYRGWRTGALSLPINTWLHVAVTLDLSTETALAYLNGETFTAPAFDGSSIGASLYNGDTPFIVGAWNATPANHFDGQIKHVRVFSDIRTQAEITTDARTTNVSDANLVAEWVFASDYLDSTANNNDLTSSGSPVFVDDIGQVGNKVSAYYALEDANDSSPAALHLTAAGNTTYLAGKVNNAAELDGTNDYLDGNDILDTTATAPFSISAWVEPDATAASYGIVIKYNDATDGPGYLFYNIATGKLRFILQTDLGAQKLQVATTNTVLTNNTYAHVVLSYDGSQTAAGVHIYVNGVEVATTSEAATLAGGTTTNATSFNIGAGNDGSAYDFDGEIDEVGIWARALDYGDVLDLYDDSNGITYSPLSTFVPKVIIF